MLVKLHHGEKYRVTMFLFSRLNDHSSVIVMHFFTAIKSYKISVIEVFLKLATIGRPRDGNTCYNHEIKEEF